MTSALRSKIEEIRATGSSHAAFNDSFMGDEGCLILQEGLANNRTLKSLDLRGCNIHCDGTVALAKLLEGAGIRKPGTAGGSTQAHNLQVLGLEWNGIGTFESGIQALCKALSNNASLSELDLRNNSVSPAGGAAIAAMLTRNKSLRRIDLRWNNIGMSGGKAIEDALRSNEAVVEVLLAGNKVSEECLAEIEALLERNRRGPPPAVDPSDWGLEEAASPIKGSPQKGGVAAGSSLSGSRQEPLIRSIVDKPLGGPMEPPGGVGLHGGDYDYDALEQSFRDKMMEMSAALMSEKQQSMQFERKWKSECQAREEFEQKTRELESVSDALQDKVSSMERGHELKCKELESQVQRSNDAKASAELELKQAMAHVASLEEMANGRLKTASKSLEVKDGVAERLQREVDELRKELSTQQDAAAEARASLLEQLRQSEQGRIDGEFEARKRAQEKVTEVEGKMMAMQKEHEAQIKYETEQLKITRKAKDELEAQVKDVNVQLHRQRVEYEQQIVAIQEGMKKEEEARLSLLDERIVSIQQSRDLLQQRADQQSYEIAELRKLERQRVQEQDVFLKNEAQLRMAAEKEVEAKTTEAEKLAAELMHAKHRLEAAEATVTRLESQAKTRADQHEAAIKRIMEETAESRKGLEQLLFQDEGRVSALEIALRAKEMELLSLRDEEAQRLASLEEKIIANVRQDLVKMRSELKRAGE